MSAFSSVLTGFERFWNSSFGLPQQLIFRALRVAQGDASFFSEKGFLDKALIPILGGFDAERQDVHAKEMVQRVNSITGLDLDEDHFAAQLGVGIATDPLSFLTSGLTAGAKSTGALLKGVRTQAVKGASKLTKEEDILALGREKLAATLDEALDGPELLGKDRRKVQAARAALDDIEGDDLVKAAQQAGKREQLIAAPIVGAWVGPKIRVSNEYESWFQLLRDKGGANKAAAWLTSGPLQGIPGIRHATGVLAGFAAGLRDAGMAPRVLQMAAAPDLTQESLAVVQRTQPLAKQLLDSDSKWKRILAAAAKGREQSFIKQVMGTEDASLKDALELLGVGSMSEVTEDTLQRFLIEHDGAVEGLRHASDRVAFTEQAAKSLETRKLASAEVGYKAGRGLKLGLRKMFVSDAPGTKEFDTAVRKIRDRHATDTQQIAKMSVDLMEQLARDAEKLGIPFEEMDEIQSLLLQTVPLQDEIDAAIKSGAVDRFTSLADRIDSAVGILVSRLEPRVGQGNEAIDQLYNQVVESFGAGGTSGRVRLNFGDVPAKTFRVEDAAPPTGPKVNRHIDSESGHYLGHMTDRQLRRRQSKLARKGTRKMEGEELKRAVNRSPELKEAAKALEVTPEEMAQLARRRGGTKGFPRLERLELDEMERNMVGAAANGVYRSLKFKDKAALVTRLLKGGKVRKDLAEAARELKPLITLLRSKGFKDVDDVMDLLTLARGKRIKRLAPGVQLNELARPLLNLANKAVRELDQPIFDRKLLSKGEQADYDGVRNLMGLRKQDVRPVARVRPKKQRIVEEAGPRPLTEVDVVEGEWTPALESIGRIKGLAAELRRLERTGVESPALMAELGSETVRLSSLFVEPIVESLREVGAAGFFDSAQKMRQGILDSAVRTGTLGDSAPLAYLGHFYSQSTAKALDDLLGKHDAESVLSKALPHLSSSFRRSSDGMTIQELNIVIEEAARAGNTELHTALLDFAKANDIPVGKIEESAAAAMIMRLSQANQAETIVETVGGMFDAAAATGAAVAGKVVGVVDDAGSTKTLLPDGRVSEAALDETGGVVDVGVERTKERGFSALIIEDHTGAQRVIPMSQLDAKFKGLKLGKYSSLEGGKDVNKAFNNFSSRGSDAIPGSGFGSGNRAEELLDEFVVIGDSAAVDGMANAYAKQYQAAPAVIAAFDPAINLVKRFQTTFRLNFHIANLAGVLPMAMTAGARPKSILLGVADYFRFVGADNAALVKEYSRYHDIMSEPSRSGFVSNTLNPAQDVVGTIRGTGKSGLRSTEEVAEAVGKEAESLMFQSRTGEVYDIGEIMDALIDNAVLTGFIADDLRGVSSTPERLRKMLASLHKGKSPEGVLDRASAALGVEGSENAARLTTFFSLLHSGQGIKEAATNTVAAMVPYHQLTRLEREWAKRLFTYYSFPRHYLPQAGKYFATRPDIAARYAHTINAEGGVVERDGRLLVNTDIGTINLSRLDPNLEALQSLKAIGEVFTDVGAVFSEEAQSIKRQREAVGRDTPFPVEPGSPAEIAAQLAQFNFGDALTEAGEAFWFTRYFLAEDDPLGETGPLTQLFESVVLPVKVNRPEHNRRVAVARYNTLKRTLQKKLQLSGNDPQKLRDYQAELQRVEAALTAQLEGK
jgi:hypothetical protein